MTTGVVIKWFTGTETDGAHLKTMHQLHDGHFDLTALNEWAQRGFDQRWLKNAYPPPMTAYPATETEYTRNLAKRVGLGTSKTALSLLGKAKAMKNVGDLNLFIRENMLDVPGTFDAAATMIGLFEPLNEAFETARRAHEQQQVLDPVPAAWAAYCAARRDSAAAEAAQGTTANRYLRGVHLALLQAEITQLEKDIASRSQQLADQDRQAKAAKTAYQSLDDQLRAEGKDLASLESELEQMTSQHAAQHNAYQIFSGHLAHMGMDSPARPGRLHLAAGPAPRRTRARPRNGGSNCSRDTGKPPGRLEKRPASTGNAPTELAAVQSSGSLLPARAIERREAIARGAQVPAADLAYAAELIDLADGEERWRPAAEKVLRSYGLRLLVPDRHKDAVRAFIDQHDMRGVVDYSIVTAISAHQPRPATRHARLQARGRHHPSQRVLARRPAHPPVRARMRRDRPRPGTSSRSGDRTRHGQAARQPLPQRRPARGDQPLQLHPGRQHRRQTRGARARSRRPSRRPQAGRDRSRPAGQRARQPHHHRHRGDPADSVTPPGTTWITGPPRAPPRTSRNGSRQLKAANVNLQRLQEQRDEAEATWEQLVGACRKTKDAINDMATGRRPSPSALPRRQANPSPSPMANASTSTRSTRGCARRPQPMRSTHSAKTSARQLERCKREAEQGQRIAATEIQAAISIFTSRWPDSAPDTSGDADRCGADFAALHEEITRRRLPEAMHRFQTMISEDMVPSVSVVYRTIETAAAEIRRRADMVNVGLKRVEFNQGTHLQIAVNAHQFESVRQFRSAVDDLLKNAPAARATPQQALAQFTRVRDLMVRFTATTPSTSAGGRRSWMSGSRSASTAAKKTATVSPSTPTATPPQDQAASRKNWSRSAWRQHSATTLPTTHLARRPRFAPLMLDEAFSKSDETFAGQALAAFDEFGFQLIMAAPIRMSGVLEPFIGQAVLVEKRLTPDGAHSNATSATFGELAVRREAETDGTHAAA